MQIPIFLIPKPTRQRLGIVPVNSRTQDVVPLLTTTKTGAPSGAPGATRGRWWCCCFIPLPDFTGSLVQHFNAFHGPKCQGTKLGCIGDMADMGLVEASPWEFIFLFLTMGTGGRPRYREEANFGAVGFGICLSPGGLWRPERVWNPTSGLVSLPPGYTLYRDITSPSPPTCSFSSGILQKQPYVIQISGIWTMKCCQFKQEWSMKSLLMGVGNHVWNHGLGMSRRSIIWMAILPCIWPVRTWGIHDSDRMDGETLQRFEPLRFHRVNQMCIILRIEKSLPRDTADTPWYTFGVGNGWGPIFAGSQKWSLRPGPESKKLMERKNGFFFTLCGHEQVAIDLIARIL